MLNFPYQSLQPAPAMMPAVTPVQSPSNINMHARQAAASALANAPPPATSPWPGILQNLVSGAASVLNAPDGPGAAAENWNVSLPSQSVQMPGVTLPGSITPSGVQIPSVTLNPAEFPLPNSFSFSTPALPAPTVGSDLWSSLGFGS